MSATKATKAKYETRRIDLERASKEQLLYRDRVNALLVACRWNVSEAARKAKLSRTAMYRRIYALGLKVPSNFQRGTSIFDRKIAGVSR